MAEPIDLKAEAIALEQDVWFLGADSRSVAERLILAALRRQWQHAADELDAERWRSTAQDNLEKLSAKWRERAKGE